MHVKTQPPGAGFLETKLFFWSIYHPRETVLHNSNPTLKVLDSLFQIIVFFF